MWLPLIIWWVCKVTWPYKECHRSYIRFLLPISHYYCRVRQPFQLDNGHRTNEFESVKVSLESPVDERRITQSRFKFVVCVCNACTFVFVRPTVKTCGAILDDVHCWSNRDNTNRGLIRWSVRFGSFFRFVRLHSRIRIHSNLALPESGRTMSHPRASFCSIFFLCSVLFCSVFHLTFLAMLFHFYHLIFLVDGRKGTIGCLSGHTGRPCHSGFESSLCCFPLEW